MGLHDVDKNSDDRSSPVVNAHDKGPDVRMAHGTTSVNYVTDATNQSLIDQIHSGFFTIVQTGVVEIPAITTDTTIDPPTQISTVTVNYNPDLGNPIVLSYLVPPIPLVFDYGNQVTAAVGTVVDDSTIGSVTWSDPSNAILNDGMLNNATALLSSTLGDDIQDTTISIVRSDGTIGAENKATFTNTSTYPTSDALQVGGVNDLWSETWTPDDINNSDFGVVISYSSVTDALISHYLKITNLGFAVPSDAIITGITLSYRASKVVSGSDSSAAIQAVQVFVNYKFAIDFAQWNTSLMIINPGVTSQFTLGRILTNTQTDSGILTFQARINYTHPGIGTVTDGPWNVKYYILRESAR